MSGLIQSMLEVSGKGVRIAILDSGFDPNYARLKNRKDKIFDCRMDGGSIRIEEIDPRQNSDRSGHGSCVQSCVVSVAPDIEIDHYRILDKENYCDARLLCYVLDRILAARYQIVNLSLGTSNEEYLPWLVSIMKRAYENSIIVTAAAGRSGSALFPGNFTYTISVEATEALHPMEINFQKGNVIEFSAMGVNVPMSTGVVTISVSGSSYACAHVTGLVARVLSLHPDWNPLEVKLFLIEYASAIKNQKFTMAH